MQCAATILASVLAGGPPASVTPIDSGADSIVGYILSYGVLGVVFLALAWLMFKGWRLVPRDYEARIRADARTEARADLAAERDRVLAEKRQAEEQRDEALAFARDQLTPLLISFTSSTQALMPLLQNLVGQRDPPQRRRRGGPDP